MVIKGDFTSVRRKPRAEALACPPSRACPRSGEAGGVLHCSVALVRVAPTVKKFLKV